MFRNAAHLENFELRARDGRIGHVTDLFFDDRQWTVRYLVVDAGEWLQQREVLIAPSVAHAVDWNERVIPVDLTCDQIRRSPPIDTDEPISREQELALIQYYNWPMYWSSAGFADGLVLAAPPFLPVTRGAHARTVPASTVEEQHHVRSMADVRRYRIVANDGEIGHVDDFLVDDETWMVGYFVVDTRNWWPGKRVLVAPEWVYDLGWDEAKVYIDLSRDAIRRSPAYDPHVPPTAEYMDQLHAYYGQPRRSAEP